MIKPFNYNKGNKYKKELQQKYIPADQLLRPSLTHKKQTQAHTKSTVDRLVSQKTFVSQKATANQIKTKTDSQYVKFKPKNSKKQRIALIQEIQEDPFCPPQYKNKRIPHGSKGTPDVLLQDPPRKVTQEDQNNWKIPPCISNSKNSRGFVLPLQMRISADGRNTSDPRINERFLSFSNALYQSEKQGRKALEEKKRIQQTLAHEELIKREEKIKREIEKTKREKDSLFQKSVIESKIESDEDSDGEKEAEEKRGLIRKMIKKNAEREVRMKNMGSNRRKEIRDVERDLAEKIALGQKVEGKGVVEIDDRVADLVPGLDSGFKGEDAYDLYDKPLFNDAVKTNIYTGAKNFGEEFFEDSLRKRETIGNDNKSHKEKVLKRNKPVEFEKFSG